MTKREQVNLWFDKNYHHLVDVFIFSILLATLSFIVIFLVPIVTDFSIINDASKTGVTESILQGTLTIGAIALTVLGYAFSQMQGKHSTEERAPYKRIVYIMYFITPLSMADVTTSVSFLLTNNMYAFQASLVLLYIIVVGLAVSVSLWVRKELK